ncbi:MAG: DNA-deoxyinosine glycosylase [Ruminococcaceae bacterium]|nr:DNA-deoxyinosine glycosylase [Oscillospiraceae bacterium]
MLVHNFEPVFSGDSKILILGSFPSVKSREQGFYYGHPRNRFWRVMAEICGEDTPLSIEDKKKFLLNNKIALWDVIKSCEIENSSDASVRNVTANDIGIILDNSSVSRVFANGRLAGNLYNKYCLEKTGREITVLPSTSPANAAYSFEELAAEWKITGREL